MDLGFEMGQKVKCINSRFKDDLNSPFRISEITTPKSGENYTIRDVVKTLSGTGIRLNEIKNKQYFFKKLNRWEEPYFGAYRFKVFD